MDTPHPAQAHICGFILLAKNWSLTKFFLDSIDSNTSWLRNNGNNETKRNKTKFQGPYQLSHKLLCSIVVSLRSNMSIWPGFVLPGTSPLLWQHHQASQPPSAFNKSHALDQPRISGKPTAICFSSTTKKIINKKNKNGIRASKINTFTQPAFQIHSEHGTKNSMSLEMAAIHVPSEKVNRRYRTLKHGTQRDVQTGCLT